MNESTHPINQVLQKTLNPDIKVHYTDNNTATVYVSTYKKEFVVQGDIYRVLLLFWKHCFTLGIMQSSILIFDQHNNILCNGNFSFESLLTTRKIYLLATYQLHLFILDTNDCNIVYSIAIDNTHYTSDFNIKTEHQDDITNWYEYFCTLRPTMLKLACTRVLHVMHDIPIERFEQDSFCVTIHHIDMATYTWRYCHRSLPKRNCDT